MEPSGPAPLREAMRYAQVGITLVTPMGVLGWLGYTLDRRLGSSPWLLLLGLVLGMGAGFVTFLRQVLQPPGGGRGR